MLRKKKKPIATTTTTAQGSPTTEDTNTLEGTDPVIDPQELLFWTTLSSHQIQLSTIQRHTIAASLSDKDNNAAAKCSSATTGNTGTSWIELDFGNNDNTHDEGVNSSPSLLPPADQQDATLEKYGDDNTSNDDDDDDDEKDMRSISDAILIGISAEESQKNEQNNNNNYHDGDDDDSTVQFNVRKNKDDVKCNTTEDTNDDDDPQSIHSSSFTSSSSSLSSCESFAEENEDEQKEKTNRDVIPITDILLTSSHTSDNGSLAFDNAKKGSRDDHVTTKSTSTKQKRIQHHHRRRREATTVDDDTTNDNNDTATSDDPHMILLVSDSDDDSNHSVPLLRTSTEIRRSKSHNNLNTSLSNLHNTMIGNKISNNTKPKHLLRRIRKPKTRNDAEDKQDNNVDDTNNDDDTDEDPQRLLLPDTLDDDSNPSVPLLCTSTDIRRSKSYNNLNTRMSNVHDTMIGTISNTTKPKQLLRRSRKPKTKKDAEDKNEDGTDDVDTIIGTKSTAEAAAAAATTTTTTTAAAYTDTVRQESPRRFKKLKKKRNKTILASSSSLHMPSARPLSNSRRRGSSNHHHRSLGRSAKDEQLEYITISTTTTSDNNTINNDHNNNKPTQRTTRAHQLHNSRRSSTRNDEDNNNITNTGTNTLAIPPSNSNDDGNKNNRIQDDNDDAKMRGRRRRRKRTSSKEKIQRDTTKKSNIKIVRGSIGEDEVRACLLGGDTEFNHHTKETNDGQNEKEKEWMETSQSTLVSSRGSFAQLSIASLSDNEITMKSTVVFRTTEGEDGENSTNKEHGMEHSASRRHKSRQEVSLEDIDIEGDVESPVRALPPDDNNADDDTSNNNLIEAEIERIIYHSRNNIQSIDSINKQDDEEVNDDTVSAKSRQQKQKQQRRGRGRRRNTNAERTSSTRKEKVDDNKTMSNHKMNSDVFESNTISVTKKKNEEAEHDINKRSKRISSAKSKTAHTTKEKKSKNMDGKRRRKRDASSNHLSYSIPIPASDSGNDDINSGDTVVVHTGTILKHQEEQLSCPALLASSSICTDEKYLVATKTQPTNKTKTRKKSNKNTKPDNEEKAENHNVPRIRDNEKSTTQQRRRKHSQQRRRQPSAPNPTTTTVTTNNNSNSNKVTLVPSKAAEGIATNGKMPLRRTNSTNINDNTTFENAQLLHSNENKPSAATPKLGLMSTKTAESKDCNDYNSSIRSVGFVQKDVVRESSLQSDHTTSNRSDSTVSVRSNASISHRMLTGLESPVQKNSIKKKSLRNKLLKKKTATPNLIINNVNANDFFNSYVVENNDESKAHCTDTGPPIIGSNTDNIDDRSNYKKNDKDNSMIPKLLKPFSTRLLQTRKERQKRKSESKSRRDVINSSLMSGAIDDTTNNSDNANDDDDEDCDIDIIRDNSANNTRSRSIKSSSPKIKCPTLTRTQSLPDQDRSLPLQSRKIKSIATTTIKEEN